MTKKELERKAKLEKYMEQIALEEPSDEVKYINSFFSKIEGLFEINLE